MKVEDTDIEGVKLITPRRFEDDRGFFSEVYSGKAFAEAGLEIAFVQDNHSLSVEVGTVRGLHFQTPPFAQDKLVRVVRGAILDVAVDLRRGSKTFGRHVRAELSSRNWLQMFVPKGFAHGFVTLEPNTEVLYKVTNFYSPAHDAGLAFDDPELGVDWGLDPAQAILSPKDCRHPRLAQLQLAF
jgi:dTDP-4-dehydrorhamnose 3,5-epimerase